MNRMNKNFTNINCSINKKLKDDNNFLTWEATFWLSECNGRRPIITELQENNGN